MGYYTNYSLSFSPENKNDRIGKDKYDAILRELSKMNVFDDEECTYAYDKWYDHDKDMRLISSKFPGIVFELDGNGEESDDIWVSYYLNGGSQFAPAQIQFDKFCRNKLTYGEITDRYSYQDTEAESNDRL